jgi:alkylhydroperoxidase family enzyme
MSGTRLPLLDDDSLTCEQRALAERVSVKGRAWPGPYNALARIPAVGIALHALMTALKREPLAPAQQEVAILTVAAEMRCAYGWHAHIPVALDVGVPEEPLARLGAGVDPGFSDAVLHETWHVARQLVGDSAAAQESLGRLIARDERAAVTLTALIGAYQLIFQLVGLDDRKPNPSSIALAAGSLCQTNLEQRHV